MSGGELKVPLPIQNEQSVIWRFMDFTKLVSLLDNNCLFLCRADNLDDPYEGASTKPNVELWKQDYFMRKIREGIMGHAEMQRELQDIAGGLELLKKFVFINSWHMSEYESAAMWKLYAKTNEAVAIKSTYKRLRECLPISDQLLIGQVGYIDYENESLEEKNITDRFFYKRKSFEHENEVRALVLNLPKEIPSNLYAVETEGGIYIRTSVDMLIEKVFVAPRSPSWFQELVENVVKLYGFHKEVVRTSLDDTALY